MSRDKGPTRAQLRAQVSRLEKKLAHYVAGDRVRQEGEHWYELVEYFDTDRIERIQIPGAPERTFFMGMLEHSIIIQVPQGESPEAIRKFTDILKAKGVTAPVLVVTEGVRFLKLAVVPEAMESRLDAAEQKDTDEESKGAAGAVPDGLGPELDGDGLGDRGPEGGEGSSGRSDPHEEGEAC